MTAPACYPGLSPAAVAELISDVPPQYRDAMAATVAKAPPFSPETLTQLAGLFGLSVPAPQRKRGAA
jgi:hypothetical protein